MGCELGKYSDGIKSALPLGLVASIWNSIAYRRIMIEHREFFIEQIKEALSDKEIPMSPDEVYSMSVKFTPAVLFLLSMAVFMVLGAIYGILHFRIRSRVVKTLLFLAISALFVRLAGISPWSKIPAELKGEIILYGLVSLLLVISFSISVPLLYERIHSESEEIGRQSADESK